MQLTPLFMRNLWIFISKYNAIFLFCIFFIFSLTLLIKNNSYQRASTWNSSNEWIADKYERVKNFNDYLDLKEVNESLAAENGRLRNQISPSEIKDSVEVHQVKDSITQKQYSYITAKVINNSIRQKNNYITINRGLIHGIKTGMGVIGPNGVVGIVLNVSPKYATIQSLLHSDTRISASLTQSQAFGSLVWDSGSSDSRFAILQDIPNHIKVKPGDQVVTSGYSLFPSGMSIGTVTQTGLKGGDSFLEIKVRLSTDFSTLKYVYVVNNTMAEEQAKLESLNKK
ncbi:MAG: rod shape-determining protein MreC [Sphingobacteriaceae bacterium]